MEKQPLIFEIQTSPSEQKHKDEKEVMIDNIKEASKTSLQVVRQVNFNFWDDYKLLLPQVFKPNLVTPTLDQENRFTYEQMTRETLWFSSTNESLIQTNNKNRGTTYNYFKLLEHSDKYIVAIGSNKDPKRQNTSIPAQTDEGKPVYWPATPPDAAIIDWHLKGFKQNVVSTLTSNKKSLNTKPIYFGTFETLNLEAINAIFKQDEEQKASVMDTSKDPNSESLKDILNQDKQKRIEAYIQERTTSILGTLVKLREKSLRPIQKNGDLIIGTFVNQTETLWNTTEWKLPFHTVSAVLSEPHFNHIPILATCADRIIQLWDLEKIENGPMASLEIPEIKKRTITQMILTSTMIVILDGQGQLIIVPYYLSEFYQLRRFKPNSEEFKIKSNQVWEWSLNNPMYLVLNTPTACSLSANPMDPRVFCMGTFHGFVHEFGFVAQHPSIVKESTLAKFYSAIMNQPFPIDDKIEETTFTLYHMHTFYTRSGHMVDTVIARGSRVLALTTTNAYMFFGYNIIGNNPKNMCMAIETDDNDNAKIRNITFAGNLIVIETAKRHLFVINLVAKKQRIIPTVLGSLKLAQTPEADQEREYWLANLNSIFYFDSTQGFIRTIYANRTLDTIQLPPLDLSIPSADHLLQETEEKKQALNDLFEKADTFIKEKEKEPNEKEKLNDVIKEETSDDADI